MQLLFKSVPYILSTAFGITEYLEPESMLLGLPDHWQVQ